MKIILIGAGNLATQLAVALHKKGVTPACVFSRTEESARRLSERLNGVPYTTVIDRLPADGDLYIFISVKKHKLYSREGGNLYATVPLSMTTAALGGKIEIPAIDGEKLDIDIAPGTQNDQVIKVKGQGMPIMRSARKGDLFVKVRVETPVNLTDRQKELLEEFRTISQENACQPEAKGFFDKIKDLFVA